MQLAAYTHNDQFGQYIMPLMNLNPAARQRHQIRVITVGFFRMLKSMQTYKVTLFGGSFFFYYKYILLLPSEYWLEFNRYLRLNLVSFVSKVSSAFF